MLESEAERIESQEYEDAFERDPDDFEELNRNEADDYRNEGGE